MEVNKDLQRCETCGSPLQLRVEQFWLKAIPIKLNARQDHILREKAIYHTLNMVNVDVT
jgi:hypothetical protein